MWFTSSFPTTNGQIEDLEAFSCLYEIQEEQFVKNALEHFTKLEIRRKKLTHVDQIVVSFCVKNCLHLESLFLRSCEFVFETHGRVEEEVEEEEKEELPIAPKRLCQ